MQLRRWQRHQRQALFDRIVFVGPVGESCDLHDALFHFDGGDQSPGLRNQIGGGQGPDRIGLGCLRQGGRERQHSGLARLSRYAYGMDAPIR